MTEPQPELLEWITEFLVFYNFNKTAKQFEAEQQRLATNNLGTTRKSQEDESSTQKDKLMNFLQKGKTESFFELWDKRLPVSSRLEKGAVMIQFFLRLFFASYHLRDTNNQNSHDGKERIEYFKAYLEMNGPILSNYPELLPYFAFPYVSNPKHHPTFEKIFSEEWRQNLLTDLTDFVTTYMNSDIKLPRLQTFFEKSSTTQEIRTTEDKKLEKTEENTIPPASKLEKRVSTAKDINLVAENPSKPLKEEKNTSNPKIIEKLMSECEKVIEISKSKYDQLYLLTGDLVKALFGTQNGKKLNPNFLAIAHKKFRGLGDFSTNFPVKFPLNLNENPNLSPTRESRIVCLEKEASYAPLDFKKIANCIFLELPLSKDNKKVPKLFQALRWRISKPSRRIRIHNLMSFINNDIFLLKIHSEKSNGNNKPQKQYTNMINFVFENDLDPKRSATEYMLRLMNTMLNEILGVEYIVSQLQQHTLIEECCKILDEDSGDSVILQMAIGILQKLSARNLGIQKNLIEFGTLEAIFTFFAENCKQIGNYSLEFGLALLVNLLSCATDLSVHLENEIILDTLLEIIENSEDDHILSLLNGVLFLVVKNSQILKQKAKENRNFEAILISKSENKPEHDNEVQFILQELQNENLADQEAKDEPANEFTKSISLLGAPNSSSNLNYSEECEEYNDQEIQTEEDFTSVSISIENLQTEDEKKKISLAGEMFLMGFLDNRAEMIKQSETWRQSIDLSKFPQLLSTQEQLQDTTITTTTTTNSEKKLTKRMLAL